MKTQKVLNKIDNCNRHGNEGQLGKHNDDECYTPYSLVEDELDYWKDKGKFKGKSVISPCDFDIIDSEDGKTREFFGRHGIDLTKGEYLYAMKVDFDDRSWPSKISLSFNDVSQVDRQEEISLFDLEEDSLPGTVKLVLSSLDDIREFYASAVKCNFARYFLSKSAALGIRSYTASGYDPATGKGIPFQKVDFSKYDVCVTNPPFSIYREFLGCVLGKCDFCCVAPLLNRTVRDELVPMMEGRLFLGRTRDASVPFDRYEFKGGQLAYTGIKKVCCDYIVSWPEAQDDVNAMHYCPAVKYEDYKSEYISMPGMQMKDGANPIKVPAQFPGDYDGWMFGSFGHLDKLDQSRYEWYGARVYRYLPEKSPFLPVNKDTDLFKLPNGKDGFNGIVFRKKKDLGAADA